MDFSTQSCVWKCLDIREKYDMIFLLFDTNFSMKFCARMMMSWIVLYASLTNDPSSKLLLLRVEYCILDPQGTNTR